MLVILKFLLSQDKFTSIFLVLRVTFSKLIFKGVRIFFFLKEFTFIIREVFSYMQKKRQLNVLNLFV